MFTVRHLSGPSPWPTGELPGIESYPEMLLLGVAT